MKRFFILAAVVLFLGSLSSLQAIVFTSVIFKNETDSKINLDIQYQTSGCYHDTSRSVAPFGTYELRPGICFVGKLGARAEGGVLNGKSIFRDTALNVVDAIVTFKNNAGNLGMELINAYNMQPLP